MSAKQWYELRVAGSAGTTTGGAGIREGIVISENGRLCSIQSAKAMKFPTEREAFDYLATVSLPGPYSFETVLCKPVPPPARNLKLPTRT